MRPICARPWPPCGPMGTSLIWISRCSGPGAGTACPIMCLRSSLSREDFLIVEEAGQRLREQARPRRERFVGKVHILQSDIPSLFDDPVGKIIIAPTVGGQPGASRSSSTATITSAPAMPTATRSGSPSPGSFTTTSRSGSTNSRKPRTSRSSMRSNRRARPSNAWSPGGRTPVRPSMPKVTPKPSCRAMHAPEHPQSHDLRDRELPPWG